MQDQFGFLRTMCYKIGDRGENNSPQSVNNGLNETESKSTEYGFVFKMK